MAWRALLPPLSSPPCGSYGSLLSMSCVIACPFAVTYTFYPSGVEQMMIALGTAYASRNACIVLPGWDSRPFMSLARMHSGMEAKDIRLPGRSMSHCPGHPLSHGAT